MYLVYHYVYMQICVLWWTAIRLFNVLVTLYSVLSLLSIIKVGKWFPPTFNVLCSKYKYVLKMYAPPPPSPSRFSYDINCKLSSVLFFSRNYFEYFQYVIETSLPCFNLHVHWTNSRSERWNKYCYYPKGWVYVVSNFYDKICCNHSYNVKGTHNISFDHFTEKSYPMAEKLINLNIFPEVRGIYNFRQ